MIKNITTTTSIWEQGIGNEWKRTYVDSQQLDPIAAIELWNVNGKEEGIQSRYDKEAIDIDIDIDKI